MNRRLSAAGRTMTALALCAALAACGGRAGNEYKDDNTLERLASCSIADSPFEVDDFKEWKDRYHATVSEVIQADIDSLNDPQCIDRDDNLPPPTQELKDLAATLPPWKDAPTRLERLSEADLSAVLLEYLRTYQCAMLEYRGFYLPTEIIGSGGKVFTRGEVMERQAEAERLIENELSVSRLAMSRTLNLTGRLNRLRPLFFDIDCFVAASMDLRNEMGLMAQIGSCMPRVQDAHGSLRDFKIEEKLEDL